MKKIILLNKKEGETPLQSLENFRKKNPKYLNVPLTYAGRLDPMASGVLLILAGDEVLKKQKYLEKDKVYKFQILFGFSTDTHDILGEVLENYKDDISKENLKKNIKNMLKNLKGKYKQKYPLYSSKTVKGRPLFSYARKGEKVEIPEREVFIKKINLQKITKIDSKKLLKNIEKRIKKVDGDFRQEKIIKTWRKHLKNESSSYYLADLNIKCSSGTYVRVVANSIGEILCIPALAFSIKRTKIC